jgi:Heterokaryon incompatibility protein (HET)
MPTRLLKIRINAGTYAISLVEGAACEPYVTPSHCWGKTPAATTTASTLEDRIRDVPWPMLTQTFKDAVALTEQLGYQYLWIDVLAFSKTARKTGKSSQRQCIESKRTAT